MSVRHLGDMYLHLGPPNHRGWIPNSSPIARSSSFWRRKIAVDCSMRASLCGIGKNRSATDCPPARMSVVATHRPFRLRRSVSPTKTRIRTSLALYSSSSHDALILSWSLRSTPSAIAVPEFWRLTSVLKQASDLFTRPPSLASYFFNSTAQLWLANISPLLMCVSCLFIKHPISKNMMYSSY
ncbi:uncharacterized protein VTP21DRAFT_4402 [Calcarisporiella thermophila]|uniref:uncharacterized protein n=1 Tax=Calcarisporiella thermophila TaxID=911321 RepID=UPI003743126F